MKNHALFIMISLVTVLFSMQAIYAETPDQMQTNSQTVTLDMQNMTCAMCKITIKRALQGVDGVQQVNVNSDSQTATITFEPKKTNSNHLIKATTHAGYPATVRLEK